MVCLPLLVFSLCSDAMKRPASTTNTSGAAQPATRRGERKADLCGDATCSGAAQPAAKAVKKCGQPRCRKDAASSRAKFCTACFKKRAKSSNSRRKVFRGNSGARGITHNRGNSSAKGIAGNSGNTVIGQEKKFAGERSALRRSTKMLLVVKNPWLDLILAGKKTWEIRGAPTKVRGKIHLALGGGGGRIVGQCDIADSFAVDRGMLEKHVAEHCVEGLATIAYRRPHAWVLSNARRYETPFVYSHPRGAIRWVKL